MNPPAADSPPQRARFTPPGPGSWVLDVAHCEGPRSAYGNELFESQYTEGFREGFARYGALLDTIEFRAVEGFPYTAVRPLGAPPDAKGPPPKWVFKALLALHPALRARCRRAREVMEGRVWREDIKAFWEGFPEVEASLAAIAATPISTLDERALAEVVERTRALAASRLREHFARAPATMLPVGDFVAQVREWTGAPPSEPLDALRGYSPAPVAGTRALREAAEAVANDPEARALLDRGGGATETLAAIRALPGPAGSAVARLLERYGDVITTGHDLSHLRLAEMPALILASLRAKADARGDDDARAAAERAASALRAKVPEAHHASFDELLAEARDAYPLRDARGALDYWCLGLLRRVVQEAGRRLSARGAIAQPDDVFDCSHAELTTLLRGAKAPTAEELAQRARWRRSACLDAAPTVLGPAPGAPPPSEWLPRGADRCARAVGAYIDLLRADEDLHGAAAPTVETPLVKGLGVSVGRLVGRARLIRSADDFGRLEAGDILVAPITTPAYNIILPLLGGVVTDRGGLLSHPAIVAREYGFPGVVGTRDATSRIPDGATVEIDGAAGTVRVLS